MIDTAPPDIVSTQPTEEYDVKGSVGKGAFGLVYLVQSRKSRQQYVLKKIRLARQNDWQRNATYQEVILLSRLSHPFIVPFIESWVQHGHTLNTVLGYCACGDLESLWKKHIAKSKPFEEDQLKLWLAELLLALDYLNAEGVLHRDIKSSNIFLTADGDVKLGDFGLATHRDAANGIGYDQALVGTPHYMSPELLSNEPYGLKSDLWSLGCVMYELSALRPAFNAFNMQGLIDKIKRHTAPSLPDGFSPGWNALVKSLLRKDPHARPSVKQLLNHSVMEAAVVKARARAAAIMPHADLSPYNNPSLSSSTSELILDYDSDSDKPPHITSADNHPAPAPQSKPSSPAMAAVMRDMHMDDSNSSAEGTVSHIRDSLQLPTHLAPESPMDFEHTQLHSPTTPTGDIAPAPSHPMSATKPASPTVKSPSPVPTATARVTTKRAASPASTPSPGPFPKRAAAAPDTAPTSPTPQRPRVGVTAPTASSSARKTPSTTSAATRTATATRPATSTGTTTSRSATATPRTSSDSVKSASSNAPSRPSTAAPRTTTKPSTSPTATTSSTATRRVTPAARTGPTITAPTATSAAREVKKTEPAARKPVGTFGTAARPASPTPASKAVATAVAARRPLSAGRATAADLAKRPTATATMQASKATVLSNIRRPVTGSPPAVAAAQASTPPPSARHHTSSTAAHAASPTTPTSHSSPSLSLTPAATSTNTTPTLTPKANTPVAALPFARTPGTPETLSVTVDTHISAAISSLSLGPSPTLTPTLSSPPSDSGDQPYRSSVDDLSPYNDTTLRMSAALRNSSPHVFDNAIYDTSRLTSPALTPSTSISNSARMAELVRFDEIAGKALQHRHLHSGRSFTSEDSSLQDADQAVSTDLIMVDVGTGGEALPRTDGSAEAQWNSARIRGVVGRSMSGTAWPLAQSDGQATVHVPKAPVPTAILVSSLNDPAIPVPASPPQPISTPLRRLATLEHVVSVCARLAQRGRYLELTSILTSALPKAEKNSYAQPVPLPPPPALLPGQSVGVLSKPDMNGTVRYCGPVHWDVAHDWVGLVIDNPLANTDGGVDGVHYFDAPPYHGWFVPATSVKDRSETSVGGEGLVVDFLAR